MNRFPQREQREDMKAGFIHDTESGKLEIIKYVDQNNVFVRFKGNKTIFKTITHKIRNRRITNPMFPTVRGVGYLGEGVHKAYVHHNIQTTTYRRWMRMFETCENPERNLTVCERWLNYQNFCDDLPMIDNYFKFKAYPRDYYFKVASECDEYNINSCAFIPRYRNSRIERSDFNH